jgi:chitinase
MYAEVNHLKHQNNKLKVLLSIGGWTHGTGGFSKAAETVASRTNFASNALSFIQEHNFDGIDVDWEYPGFQGGPKPGHPDDVENHVLLLEELNRVFKPAGLMVTAAFGAPPSRVDESYPETERICNALDMVNLMTYDFHGGWENVIGHHSPFTSDGNHPNDPTNTWNVKSSVDYWIEKGCPANKMTLGLGAYGRVFKATTPEVDRLAPGTTSGVRGTFTREDGYMSYYEICNWNSHIDSATQSAVAINNDLWAGFETVESANVKLDYLIEKGMKGVMWWSLDLDDFDGSFCGKGKYPLIGGVWENLKLKLDGQPSTSGPVTTTVSIGSNTASTTTITTSTTGAVTTEPETTSETTTEAVTLTTKATTTTTVTGEPTTTTSVSKTTRPVIEDLNDYCKAVGDGIWKHPTSCTSYVQCAHGGLVAVERECAAGLLWNSERKYCDWEANVLSCESCDCAAGATTKGPHMTETTVTIETTTNDNPAPTVDPTDFCSNSASGLYKYPGNCEKYIQCHNGRSYVQSCSPGTVFNSNNNQCDWPANVLEC